ncbi:MAG TPA: hypothetical protein VLM79_22910 [Kofleriaceae bacterium]|nr:hypothetical protein [Kofleriaceae bacterium]
MIGVCLACWPARAGVFKNIGRDVGAGAVEKIQPVLTATLAQAEASATRLEDHVGVVAGALLEQVNEKGKERLDQVDHILEARLLQAQVEVKDITDHALSGVKDLVNDELTTAKEAATETAKAVIKDLQAAAKDTLQKASDVIKDRVADVGREVNNAIEKADHTLAERIAQVDEVVGRRLGNVDVIASKQRVAIEETALRLAVLIGLVVFTVFVLRNLYARYSKLIAEATGGETGGGRRHARDRIGTAGSADERAAPWGPRGGARTLMFVRGLGVPLIGNLVVAALGAAVLLVLYDRLPLGARSEAIALVNVHRNGFTDSLKRFDFARARFHASQLEYLAPDDPTAHGALIAKAELLRDVIGRPTLFGTDAGIASLWKRLDESRRLMMPQVDPDLLVVEAMLLWETGESRRDELRAASLCARALRIRASGSGFALASLARAYIETFLDAPFTDDKVGLGRDSYALDDLRAVLEYAPAADSDHPLATRIRVVRLMRTLDGASSTAYADMVQAHARMVAAVRRGATAQATAARKQRLEAAEAVLNAWQAFDAKLAEQPALARDPSVLLVFRLNDAQFARAKWFRDHKDTNELAPLLVATPEQLDNNPPGKPAAKPAERPAAKQDKTAISPRVATPKDRLAMAPPRLVWARRYQVLIDGPARTLFELQEANRFAALEAAAFGFERAMIEACVAPAANATAGTCQGDPDAVARAAQAAAALGLYVSDPKAQSPRTALARKLLRAKLEGGTPAAASSKPSVAQSPRDSKQPNEQQEAENAMRGRGIRLL